MLVRATTILAAASGGIEPRWRLAATGLQIARTPPWSKKPMTIRNVPYTAVMPKPKQLAVRIAFGRIASQAKGKRRLASCRLLQNSWRRPRAELRRPPLACRRRETRRGTTTL